MSGTEKAPAPELAAADPGEPAKPPVEPDPVEAAGPAGRQSTAMVEAEPAQEAREQIESLRRERAALEEQLLRRRADFENYKRRMERERQSISAEATADLLREILPILDDLERALSAQGEGPPLREGVALIHRKLVTALESRGLRAEDPAGLPFDPERHQALAHEHAPGFAAGAVVEVFRKAYLLQDRLLRPALVKVAKEAEGEDGATRH